MGFIICIALLLPNPKVEGAPCPAIMEGLFDVEARFSTKFLEKGVNFGVGLFHFPEAGRFKPELIDICF